MSVYKQNTKVGRWSYRFMIGGERHGGICVGCQTQESAEAYEAKIRDTLSRLSQQHTLSQLFENCKDLLIRNNPYPLVDAFDKAMAKPQKRVACEMREQHKRNYWNRFVEYIKANHPECMCLQSITIPIAEDYISYIRSHGSLSNATLNEEHTTLIQVFSLLKHETGMPENPFSEIPKLPGDEDGHDPYTLEELKKIMESADDYIRPLFMIGLFSGLRLGDICTLKKSEISFERHFIVRVQRKTGHVASIPMHKYLEDYLRGIFNDFHDGEYLLPVQAEQYLKCPQTIVNRVGKFLNSLGINTSKHIGNRARAINSKGIHSLRHTFCTIAGVVGIPLTVVQSIVGHMTPRMTELYSRHVEDKDKLAYIQLFGQRMSAIPCVNVAIPIATEPINERSRILEMVKQLPEDQLAKIAKMIQ